MIICCIDMLIVNTSGCPSNNIDIIMLSRYSQLNYRLPTVIDIFSSGLVHFRLTNFYLAKEYECANIIWAYLNAKYF
jgi:hypothetical protein